MILRGDVREALDIIEPNKFTQGSVTMLKKIRDE